ERAADPAHRESEIRLGHPAARDPLAETLAAEAEPASEGRLVLVLEDDSVALFRRELGDARAHEPGAEDRDRLDRQRTARELGSPGLHPVLGEEELDQVLRDVR